MAHAGAYTPAAVQSCTALIALIAVFRAGALARNSSHQANWGSFARLVFALNLALCIRFGVMLLLRGFDLDDEVYSWNMWAVQHFLGEPIDFSYTQAPYPQLFPKLLSYCYMLLGSVEPQTAVKTALIIFPFAILTAMGLASNRNEWKFLLLHLVLCLFVLRNVDLKHLFDDGMRDTMTAAAILASIYMLQLYRQRRDSIEYLWICLVCAIVAALAKQPGLVWALFSLPLLLAMDAFRRRDSWQSAALGLIPAMSAITWMLTEGRNFEDNTGVVSRSFAQRNILEQLWFSVDTYFIQEPAIAMLAVLAVISVFRAKRGRDILLLFVVPSLLSWFLFASYDMRAGAAALVVLGFLIAHGNYGLGDRARSSTVAIRPLAAKYQVALVVLILVFALREAASTIEKQSSRDEGYTVGHSQRNNLVRLFGPEAQIVFDRVRNNEDARLWAPSHYVYGLFYGYSDVTRPASQKIAYTPKTLLEELRLENRNFATSSGDVPAGPGGQVLEQLATEVCPQLFTRIAGPDNVFHIMVYEIDSQRLNADECGL